MSQRERAPQLRKLGFAVCVASLTIVCVGLTVAASANVSAAKPSLAIGSFSICGGFGGPPSPVPRNINDPADQLAYEPLIHLKADGTLRPGLATSWRVTPGNKVITLTLRENVRFSDGTPLTAQAVKTWLDYRAKQTSLFDGHMGALRSVEVLSKYVVRMTLKSPNPIVERALSDAYDWGTVASPRAVAEAKAHPKSPAWAKQTYGAGPYVLLRSQTVINDHCTYVPNEFYYDKSKQKWSKIVTRLIVNPSTALSALRAGQVDVVLAGGGNQADAAAAAGFRVLGRAAGWNGVSLIDKRGRLAPALADVRVRQALNYAVNRRKIVRALYGRRAVATSDPNLNSDGPTPKYVNHYSYNPTKAKALLTAAGYGDGFTFKAICVGIWGGALDLQPLCHAVAADLAAVGVEMTVDAPTTQPNFAAGIGTKTFSATAFTVFDLPMFVWYRWTLKPGEAIFAYADQSGFRDPVSDRLWSRALREDAKTAARTWRQLLTRSITQAYHIPVGAAPAFTFVSKQVGGVTNTRIPSNIIDWYPIKK